MEKKNQILKKNANSNGSLISMEWNGMALFSPLPYTKIRYLLPI